MSRWVIGIMLICASSVGYSILAHEGSAPYPKAPYFHAGFTDVTQEVGLGNPGAVSMAWGDYNNDGWEDLLLTGRLLKNNKGKFQDVTQEVKLNTVNAAGVGYWGDFDNDGDLDIFFTAGRLVRNDNGVFTDISKGSGIPDLNGKFMVAAAAWGDYDNDGLIDIAIPCLWGGGTFKPGPLFLLKNNGNGKFTDVTKKAGMPDPARYDRQPRSVAWCDYDNDGDLDLFVTCYGLTPEYFFKNNGNGTFTDIAGPMGFPMTRPGSGHDIGVVWSDFDRDGYFDLYYVSQHDGNHLYKNGGPPDWGLKNVAAQVGAVAGTDKFRGPRNEHLSCAVADYDNDGWPDIYATMEKEGGTPNHLLRNKGNGTFEPVADRVGLGGQFAFSVTWCDFDNDGDQDVMIAGEGTLKLFRNDINNGNHWLHVKLVGRKSNRAAIGARVTVVTGSLTQIQEVDGGSGALSQNSLALEFGLGKAEKVDKVAVRWPTGRTQEVAVDGLDKVITVEEK